MNAASAGAATAAHPVDAGLAAPPPGDDPSAEPAPAGLGDAVQALWDDARGAVCDRVRLLLLELRLAGVTLVQLVIYAVMVAVLVVTAWLALVGGVVVGFMSAGLHWAVALAGAVVLNLAVAAWMVYAMIKMVERIGLPSRLRRFGRPAPQDAQAPPPAAAAPAEEDR